MLVPTGHAVHSELVWLTASLYLPAWQAKHVSTPGSTMTARSPRVQLSGPSSTHVIAPGSVELATVP